MIDEEHNLRQIMQEAKIAFNKYRKLDMNEKKEYEQKIGIKYGKYSNKTLRKEETKIYILFDPSGISKTIYIGKTINMSKRYNAHLYIKKTNIGRHIKNWLISLKNKNIEPKMLLLDVVPSLMYWQIWETFYIAYFKQLGYKLCNGTNGGDGTSRSVSDAQKEKHSKYLLEKARQYIGKQYNKLTIKRVSGKIWYNYIYECECECGTITNVPRTVLFRGRIKSCGCIRVETAKLNGRKRRNKSPKFGYKGVRKTPANRYSARITLNGKENHIGNFDSPEEAALAFDRKAILFIGEDISLNFPYNENNIKKAYEEAF